MNNNYYENLDENFTQALRLFEENYTHEQLIQFLRDGNIVQKQISALRLDRVKSQYEADILLDNLTGQDGKIREIVSLKIKEFVANDDSLKYFLSQKKSKIFIDAIVDINANICRNIISALYFLKNNREFCNIFVQQLIEITEKYLGDVEKLDLQDGKYKVNKEVFKLYWSLETIYVFWDKIDMEKLKDILRRAKIIRDYTIREKVAKILTKNLQDDELLNIKKELKCDSNYYVRRF